LFNDFIHVMKFPGLSSTTIPRNVNTTYLFFHFMSYLG